ncbi:MAG: hypothetical protein HOP31_06460 [Ignavibacteria bacterium]|nr:hypothetical protein [Ignavibacteria bacterium]
MKLTHQNRQPKFIEIFYSFGKKEQKDFIKFAKNPYFNRKRDHKPLLNKLLKIKPEFFKDPGININENLQKFLKINRRALWNRLSELTKIAESYLIANNTQNNRLLKNNILLEEYSKRKLTEILRLQITPAKTDIKNEKIEIDTYFSVHNLYKKISAYFSEQNNYNESAKFYKLQSEYWLLHFLIILFKQLLDTELQKRNNIDISSRLSNELLECIDKEKLLAIVKQNLPMVSIPAEIYYLLYWAFKETDGSEFYYSARDMFLKNKDMFAMEFKNEVYQYLRNYCIDKTNKGEFSYYNEIFNLNNSIIDEGLFKDLNVVNSQTNNFRNFIFAALRLDKFDWVKNFIHNHSKELPDEIRDDEVNLNTGILKTYVKDFEGALSYLKKVKRKRYLQYLDTSVYKLIIFYETNELENSYSETARLKDYIRKHKDIPVYLKSGYQKFIKIYENLLKLSQNYDKTENEYYLNQMEPIKNVGLGSWLYKKGEELLKTASKHH